MTVHYKHFIPWHRNDGRTTYQLHDAGEWTLGHYRVLVAGHDERLLYCVVDLKP